MIFNFWRFVRKNKENILELSSLNLVNSVNELLSMNVFCSLFHQITNSIRSVKYLFTNLVGAKLTLKIKFI